MGGLRNGPVIAVLSIVAIVASMLVLRISYASISDPQITNELVIETEYFSEDFNMQPDIDWNYEIEIDDEVASCTSLHHDSFIELAELARVGGFPLEEIHTAVAVAYAESLADPEAVARNRNGSKDSGLWQINSVHGLDDLKQPEVNAEAAYTVWRAQGWTAWYSHTPRGHKYGSGKRFINWLEDSKCSIKYYLSGKE